ncbi:MAG: hypothetical protein QM749_05850 [Aquabacterium sp.]
MSNKGEPPFDSLNGWFSGGLSDTQRDGLGRGQRRQHFSRLDLQGPADRHRQGAREVGIGQAVVAALFEVFQLGRRHLDGRGQALQRHALRFACGAQDVASAAAARIRRRQDDR